MSHFRRRHAQEQTDMQGTNATRHVLFLLGLRTYSHTLGGAVAAVYQASLRLPPPSYSEGMGRPGLQSG